MRKIISLGLLALLFGFFNISAFAGNADECNYLKDKEFNPDHPGYQYQPGLYGLCIAWHNAEEPAKSELADKFYERAGFDVPGLVITDTEPSGTPGFECPCWAGVVLEDIADVTAPSFCAIQSGVFWAEFSSGEYHKSFIGDGTNCVYDASYQDDSVDPPISVDDFQNLSTMGAVCLSEVMEIFLRYFPDGEGGADCLE